MNQLVRLQQLREQLLNEGRDPDDGLIQAIELQFEELLEQGLEGLGDKLVNNKKFMKDLLSNDTMGDS